ncbi:MAG: class I SAM-dependent methyltransferase [Candidatus Cloacimonadota bacterium]|nr:MAG: class I SAM-dependent methyltransferase [Candidatus Cloacimonadota bacterium]
MPLKETTPALRQLKGRHNLVGAEIGIYRGANAGFYLKELDIKLVSLIDPYVGYGNYSPVKVGLKHFEEAEKLAHEKLRNYERRIMWVKKKSSEAVKFIDDNSLDFIYIDGNHSHDSVAEDVTLYYPKLKMGGLLAGHDYDIETVRKAVDDFVIAQNLYLHKENGAGMAGKYDWWVWKEKRNG